MTKRFLSHLSLALVFAATACGMGPVDFNREVRPILSRKCFSCHGPDARTREAGLRLDQEEGWKGGRRGDRIIVPGKPDDSELIARIEESDPDEMMPPPESHLVLDAEEMEILRRWIEEGAVWEEHWAFQPLTRPEVPATVWGSNEIDAFVFASLSREAREPSPPAAPAVWLRRVTLDLTGLPPTPSDLEAFLADRSPAARKRLVDRLLGSVDFAERMATVWMDHARYADSNGYQFDNERTMWPWRDWVIEAFRANMPYDQFVTEQLAGDLLPEPTRDQLIATGFNRNHGYSIEGGIIDEEYRVTYANDKTTTFGTLFLGLTLDCTRCHDHKYDPLTMRDYYSLFAFFNTSAEAGAPGEAGRKEKVAPPFLEVAAGEGDLETPPARVMIMKERPRDTFLLKQGLFDQPGEKVEPRTPAVLPSFEGFPPNRLGLAQWLTAEANPLFARVTVNRLWQQFFGRGLVKTADNFGFQGELPTHPELLDWLAVEFRESGWDLRHLIRQIVLSATYGQSSRFRRDFDDPENGLLARGPSFRLPAEMIRDQVLAVSGLLTRKVGGPSVRPYQPEGIWEDLNAPASHAEKYQESGGADRYRKSLYTYWRRAVPHPAMVVFDAPNRNVCKVERVTTNTPLQALTVLHGPVFLESARKLAEKLAHREEPEREAFCRVLTREPTPREVQILQDLHRDRLAHYLGNPEAAARFLKVGASPVKASLDSARLAALAEVCHAIFNLSEALTRP